MPTESEPPKRCAYRFCEKVIVEPVHDAWCSEQCLEADKKLLRSEVQELRDMGFIEPRE